MRATSPPTPRMPSPTTDLTDKRDYAPCRSCSGQDSMVTRMGKLDYTPERQVLVKKVSKASRYQKRSSYSMPELCNRNKLAPYACGAKGRTYKLVNR